MPLLPDWALETMPAVVRTTCDRAPEARLPRRSDHRAELGAGLRAIYAAGRQNKLWNFAEALYRRQGAENSGWITPAVIREAAASAGANGAATGPRHHRAVRRRAVAAAQQASVDRVQGTPTFVLQRPPSLPQQLIGDGARPGHVRVAALAAALSETPARDRGAALAGIAVAAYLTIIHYTHTSPICTTGGCEKVQRSSYAEARRGARRAARARRLWRILATASSRGVGASLSASVLALVGVAFSGYLLWAQLARIHAICQWCLANDAIVAILAVLCVARLLREP